MFVYDVRVQQRRSRTTGAAIPTDADGSGPGDLVFDRSDGILYVADSGLSGLSAFNPSSYTSTSPRYRARIRTLRTICSTFWIRAIPRI